MTELTYLKHHPEYLRTLSEWVFQTWGSSNPGTNLERIAQRFSTHLNDSSLPLTQIATDNMQPIGMCSLRENDGIHPELTPWLSTLYVLPSFRKKGVGKLLVKATLEKAKTLGFYTVYLFTSNPTIPSWYIHHGFESIGKEELKGRPITVMKIQLSERDTEEKI